MCCGERGKRKKENNNLGTGKKSVLVKNKKGKKSLCRWRSHLEQERKEENVRHEILREDGGKKK